MFPSLLIPSYSSLLSNFLGQSFLVSSSRAQPRDLSCTAISITYALAGKRCLVAASFCVHIGVVCRSARKISRCARNDNAGARGLLATRHKSLATHPCFQIFGAAIPRIVIPRAAEGSFLHCGQYRIGTGREMMSCCCEFLRSHRRRLSVCKEDFSLTLEMTIRETEVF